ncbi:hypothetical protein [Persephonella sp.]|uniref:hypothetical protein n=1 Tax=Persephonella sp. TaxID=2060922 RepID=UPI0025DD7A00|nr:hypothetical protein [Persephonella sp.]
MKKFAVVGILAVFSSSYSLDFQYSLKSFTWKEYEAGKQLLKESGFLHEFGFSHRFDAEVLYIKPYAGIEIGSVKYDGQTQSGTPVKSDTNYWGVLTRVCVGKEIGLFFGETGIGYDYWKRNLETSSAIGYTETWSQFYVPLRVGIQTKMKDTKLYGFGEYRINIRTKNEPSISPVTLKPKADLFFTIGGGVEVKRLKFELSYSYDRWKKSDKEYYISGGNVYAVWQPKSKREIIRITAGYSF